MSLLCFNINELPDLTLHKYQSLSDTGIQGIIERHNQFLRLWHGVCANSNTSLHLLVYFDPNAGEGRRLKLFLILEGDQASLDAIRPLLYHTALSDFYHFNECDLPDAYFSNAATLIKREHIADIHHEASNTIKHIHYVPEWEVNESGRLYDMYRLLKTICLSYDQKKGAAYRIDLYPSDMIDSTREAVNQVVAELSGDRDIRLIKDFGNSSNNSYARSISKEYENWLSKIEGSPVFRCNIYAFASSDFQAKLLLNAVGSESVVKGDYLLKELSCLPNEKGFSLTSRLKDKVSTYSNYPKDAKIVNWATSYTLEEISPFFRFPVLYDGEFIDIQKETDPVIFDDGLFLGYDNHDYPVLFPTEYLPRHAFFTGMPGSGKTYTMLHLISELRKKDIPFLVMEPAKKEYRELLMNKDNHDINLFSPHLQSYFPLKMNPFAFVKGIQLSDHINALLNVFKGTFYLEGPTYKFLSSSIQRVYEDLGWDIEDVCDDDHPPFPTLSDVYRQLKEEIDSSDYDGELKGNLRSFLQVRLGGLMERDAGDLFNTSVSTLKPEEWLSSSSIVELETLPEQAKNFFVLLVCQYILESLRIYPNDDKVVRHVLFIEEAHNIIAPSTLQSSSDSVDPKVSATQNIVKMLAEVRALKEAIVIADQLPTALASEVTKNTGLKIVHRLTAQDEREQIGSAISASPVQMEEMASFTKGKALIYHEKTLKPFTVQISKFKAVEHTFDISNDASLYQHICNSSNSKRNLLRFFYSFYSNDISSLLNDLEKLSKPVESDHLVELKERSLQRAIFKTDVLRLYRKFIRLIKMWDIEMINENDELIDFCNEILNAFNMLLPNGK